MTSFRKLWIALITLLVASFGVLLWVGYDISLKVSAVSTNGTDLRL